MERKLLFSQHQFLPWLMSGILGLFVGYGDYIKRLFLAYLSIILSFTLLYLGLAYHPTRGHPLITLPWLPFNFPASIWIHSLLSFCIVRVPAALRASSLSHLADVLAFSVTAFHGRGLQMPQSVGNSHWFVWSAALESVLGLLIEGLFVAAFTRRVTGS